MPFEWKPFLYDASTHRSALIGLFQSGIKKQVDPEVLCQIGADIAQVSWYKSDQTMILSEALIQYAPESAAAWSFRSQALQFDKQPERAMFACDKALFIEPDHLESLAMKGKLLLQKGKDEEAQVHLRRLQGLAPKLATTMLSECLVRLRQFDEAQNLINAFRASHGPKVALSALECALCVLKQDAERLAELHDPRLISVSGSDLYELSQELAASLGPASPMVSEPASTTTVKGRQADLQHLLPYPLRREVVERIQTEVEAYVEEHAGHPYLDDRPTKPQLNAWAVSLDQQGYQDPHCHPGGWLSGVYYVEVASNAEEHDNAGAIEFWRPPVELAGDAEIETITIYPRNGMMLIFPSYYYHRTFPHRGDSNRISIAFDIG